MASPRSATTRGPTETKGREPRSKDGVQSVERAAALLEVLADAGGEASLSDLADRSGLPMPTVHRLLQTLLRAGFARQTTRRRYALGLRLIPLGELAVGQVAVEAEPLLARVRDATGETTNLVMLDGSEVVYLAQAPSRHSVRMFTEVGRRVVAHCTAVGKALLAQLGPDESRAIAASTGMPVFTENTITDLDVLAEQLGRARQVGYAIDEGEQELGVRCIAVPVPTDVPKYAISISGPASRLTYEVVDQAVPVMQQAAAALGEVLIRPEG